MKYFTILLSAFFLANMAYGQQYANILDVPDIVKERYIGKVKKVVRNMYMTENKIVVPGSIKIVTDSFDIKGFFLRNTISIGEHEKKYVYTNSRLTDIFYYEKGILVKEEKIVLLNNNTTLGILYAYKNNTSTKISDSVIRYYSKNHLQDSVIMGPTVSDRTNPETTRLWFSYYNDNTYGYTYDYPTAAYKPSYKTVVIEHDKYNNPVKTITTFNNHSSSQSIHIYSYEYYE